MCKQLFSMFMASPFDGLQNHAEKVKECAWVFQQAIELILTQRKLKLGVKGKGSHMILRHTEPVTLQYGLHAIIRMLAMT